MKHQDRECGQRGAWRETHRFYPHGGKSAERRPGVSPELSLGRCPLQPLDPAEIPLPGAAGVRLGTQTNPGDRKAGPQGRETAAGRGPSHTTSEVSPPSPSALPACPRLLTDTHPCCTLTLTHVYLCRCTTLIPLDSPIAEHTAAPGHAQRPVSAHSVPSHRSPFRALLPCSGLPRSFIFHGVTGLHGKTEIKSILNECVL